MSKMLERFWAKVDKSGDCWIWTGAIDDRGYGRFNVYGKNTHAHRWIFLTLNPDTNRELFICHKCDNPKCVRPDIVYHCGRGKFDHASAFLSREELKQLHSCIEGHLCDRVLNETKRN